MIIFPFFFVWNCGNTNGITTQGDLSDGKVNIFSNHLYIFKANYISFFFVIRILSIWIVSLCHRLYTQWMRSRRLRTKEKNDWHCRENQRLLWLNNSFLSLKMCPRLQRQLLKDPPSKNRKKKWRQNISLKKWTHPEDKPFCPSLYLLCFFLHFH